MDSLRSSKRSPKNSAQVCNLKLTRKSLLPRSLSISISLVKSPPALLRQQTLTSPPNLIHSPDLKLFNDPTDFIEPIPNTKEFMIQPVNLQDNYLRKSLPVQPKTPSNKPKVNFQLMPKKPQKIQFKEFSNAIKLNYL